MAAVTEVGVADVAGHRIDRSVVPLLVTLGLGVFAGALDLGVLSPALPALGAAFGVGPRDLAWVFTLYLLANVVSIPIATKLADRYGRRPVYIACVTVFALGSVLAIAAPTFAVFLVARAIQAAGSGGIFPVATAAIGDRVPAERRGAALGLVAATWGLAAVIGPTLGGLITHFISWHWVFALNVPLAVVVVILARKHVPAIAVNARGPLDVAGIVTLAIGLLATMSLLTRLYAIGGVVNAALAWAILIVGGVAFALFALAERRAVQPVVPPAFFRDRQLLVTYALEILIGALEGALFFIPAALVAAEHLSYAAAGAVAALGAFCFVAVIPLAGRALDAFGSRAVLTAGTLLTALGLVIFALGFGDLRVALLAMVVAGAGFGALLGAPTRYIVTSHVGPEQRASAVGLLSVFLIMGQIVGGSLGGGVASSHGDAVSGYRVAYLVFAAVAVVATLLTGALASRGAERAAARAPS
ncbi:MAG TPA: MFS transporter [Candidatus Elarobacter sp.]|nr:MFS transporter [Candidatus Elarobacter sp.]HEV2739668.1 MFS transporter [Candidatus Elarobacter sp.]